MIDLRTISSCPRTTPCLIFPGLLLCLRRIVQAGTGANGASKCLLGATMHNNILVVYVEPHAPLLYNVLGVVQ